MDPAIWVLSKTARPAPDAGAIAPEPHRLVRPVPPRGALDQWFRPIRTDTILNDTFMLYAHPQTRDVLVDRASDGNAFITRQPGADR
jgi:hypothetical protein